MTMYPETCLFFPPREIVRVARDRFEQTGLQNDLTESHAEQEY